MCVRARACVRVCECVSVSVFVFSSIYYCYHNDHVDAHYNAVFFFIKSFFFIVFLLFSILMAVFLIFQGCYDDDDGK